VKKDQIKFHSDRGPAHPALNVKVYKFPRAGQIAEHFKCSDEAAQRALNFAFESAQENFWEGASELAERYLGAGLKVYSEGRSSGWLVVYGLPEVEGWDALRVSRWSNFARAVARDIAWRCDFDQVCEAIEINQWAKDGAEKYNFIDGVGGSPACIADMKKAARLAGFGPVIRT
jgi:hypothetical protein